MKKLLIVSLLAVGLAANAGQSSSVVLALAGSFSNMLSSFSGSAKITSVVVTAPTTSHASIKMIDAITNSLTYVNPAYTMYSSYATNLITTYTNFFGATNSITNLVLVDISTAVAISTNLNPVILTATAPTNSTIVFNPVSFFVNNGIWVTNTGPTNVTVTINYQQ